MNLLRPVSSALATLCVLAATGCEQPSAESKSPATSDEARVVAVRADDEGFTPSHVDVQKGDALTLRFTRTMEKTCADSVVFPEINVKKDLPVGKPVDIEVPTDKSRKLTFQCGMGMYKSAVLVN